jgi:acetyl-CoA acyltransferase
MTMGQSAEKMAKENGISREEQDLIALRSHRNAAAAMDDGRLPPELCARAAPARLRPRRRPPTTCCAATPRSRRSPRCRPCSIRKYGTVTAGNSSPLTDGAAAVLLMSESRAQADGYEPLAFIARGRRRGRPRRTVLMGPAIAIPQALERAALTLADMDVIEMHEAFAAQVASNIQALSRASGAEQLGRQRAGGHRRPERLNVSRRLDRDSATRSARPAPPAPRRSRASSWRRTARTACCPCCAQGGMGFAMVLER